MYDESLAIMDDQTEYAESIINESAAWLATSVTEKLYPAMSTSDYHRRRIRRAKRNSSSTSLFSK
jgi:hypothetical protein